MIKQLKLLPQFDLKKNIAAIFNFLKKVNIQYISINLLTTLT